MIEAFKEGWNIGVQLLNIPAGLLGIALPWVLAAAVIVAIVMAIIVLVEIAK